MDNIIEQYRFQKKYLSSIKLEEFEYIDCGNLLATQIWKTLNRPKREIMKRILALLFCDKFQVEIRHTEAETCGRLFLKASTGNFRGDNETIIKNAEQFVLPCDEIILRKTNIVNCKKVARKILITMKCFSKFKGIKPLLSRLYYSANMTVAFALSEQFDEMLQQKKFMLTFMDTDIFENYFTQTVQFYGGKVAALQHGQRFYINEPCDSFVGMENFTADYKLVWSQFSRSQYVKAGYAESRLPIVGSTKYLQTYNKTSNISKNIGIFLDGPFSYGSREANKSMISICISTAENLDMKCILKPHPLDKMETYDINKTILRIVDPGESIEGIAEEIGIGIVHTSGVAIDLMILDVPVLVYKTEAIFPIDLPSEYFFSNVDELYDRLNRWSNNRELFMQNFETHRKQYVEEKPIELHKKFFEAFKEKL